MFKLRVGKKFMVIGDSSWKKADYLKDVIVGWVFEKVIIMIFKYWRLNF
jgi:hypothetical protein